MEGIRFFFLKKGFNVKGLDLSEIAIKNNKKIFKNSFVLKDICSKNINIGEKFDVVYSRFFLHTINEEKEKLFFENIKRISNKKATIFLEFRTTKDPLINKGLKLSENERIFTHYRRFINTKELKKNILDDGFKILRISSSFNYAKFGMQRPHICRLTIQFR